MTVRQITNYIEELAPLAYAENFDNVVIDGIQRGIPPELITRLKAA